MSSQTVTNGIIIIIIIIIVISVALIPSNLPQLKALLNDIKDDWHSLANILLPGQRHNTFEFETMLSLWLNGHGLCPTTWQTLLYALRVAGHASLASRIQQNLNAPGEIMCINILYKLHKVEAERYIQ